jgi:hypothetical protein
VRFKQKNPDKPDRPKKPKRPVVFQSMNLTHFQSAMGGLNSIPLGRDPFHSEGINISRKTSFLINLRFFANSNLKLGGFCSKKSIGCQEVV